MPEKATGKPTEEKEVIPYKKGQKIADLEILDVDLKSDRPIKFIQLQRETRENWDPRLNVMQYIPTGKIITTGEERSMTVEDFKDFVARRLTAGQVLS